MQMVLLQRNLMLYSLSNMQLQIIYNKPKKSVFSNKRDMIILMHPSIFFVTELDSSRKDYCILRCDAVQSGRNLPTFLMKVGAVLFFKRMVTASQPTWCHTLQHRNPQSHCCENLKSYTVNSVLLA